MGGGGAHLQTEAVLELLQVHPVVQGSDVVALLLGDRGLRQGGRSRGPAWHPLPTPPTWGAASRWPAASPAPAPGCKFWHRQWQIGCVLVFPKLYSSFGSRGWSGG